MDILNQVFFKCQRKWYTTRFYIKTLKLSFVLSLRYLELKLSLQCGSNHLRYEQILQGESLGCGIKGGRGWWGISYVRPRWDLYPYSPKCPILRSFRQADLSTPYSPWKILSTLFKRLIFYQVDRDTGWLRKLHSFILRNCIRKRCLLTNFPARLIFGAHDSTDIW